MISDDLIVVASENLTVARLDGESVVLDEDEGIYYGFNHVGTKILSFAQEPVAVSDILEYLRHEYPEAPVEKLRSDLFSFLEQIYEEDLIVLVDGKPNA